MFEAHLGPGLLFGSFPGLRVVCLGVAGRERALAVDDVMDAYVCVCVSLPALV